MLPNLCWKDNLKTAKETEIISKPILPSKTKMSEVLRLRTTQKSALYGRHGILDVASQRMDPSLYFYWRVPSTKNPEGIRKWDLKPKMLVDLLLQPKWSKASSRITETKRILVVSSSSKIKTRALWISNNYIQSNIINRHSCFPYFDFKITMNNKI